MNTIHTLLRNSSQTKDFYTVICNDFQDNEWDEFVCHAPGGSHLQTSLWSQVKRLLGWRVTRLKVMENGYILGGAQLLTRVYAPGISVCYVPRGPLANPGYEQITASLISQILMVCHHEKYSFLAVQPPTNQGGMVPDLVLQGFQCSKLELAPTASVVLDLHIDQEEMLAQMKRQTRQNIRRSAKEGIITRVGTADDLKKFYDLHIKTSQRQNFLPYEESYFQKMWQVLDPQGYIHLIFSDYNQEAVSALLLISFGETVCSKILGWSGLYGERRPNDALFWAAIQWSQANGYRYFDFEGVDRVGAIAVSNGEELPETLRHSPDFLKYGFGGRVELYPEAYEYIVNPVFRTVLHKLDLRVAEQTITSKILDLVRKR